MKNNIFVMLIAMMFLATGIASVYAQNASPVKSAVKAVEKAAGCCADNAACKDKCTCKECKGDGKCEAGCECCCKDGMKCSDKDKCICKDCKTTGKCDPKCECCANCKDDKGCCDKKADVKKAEAKPEGCGATQGCGGMVKPGAGCGMGK